MEVCRRSSWLLLLLGVSLLATTLQGVQGEAESEGPSESECRPYIEKALKELETGEATGTKESEESKEDAPTIEVTTDDSDHQGGEGEDEIHEEGHESTETEENVQDDQQSVEEASEQQEHENETENPEATQEETGESHESEAASAEDQKTEEVSEEKIEAEAVQASETEAQSNETGESTEEQQKEEETHESTEEAQQQTSVEAEASHEQADASTEESKEQSPAEENKEESTEDKGEISTQETESANQSKEESSEGITEPGQESVEDQSVEGEQTESIESPASHEKQDDTEETKEDDKSGETVEDNKSQAQEDDKSGSSEDDKSDAKDDSKQETAEENDSKQDTAEDHEASSGEAKTSGEADGKSAEQDNSAPDSPKEEESREDQVESADQEASKENVVSENEAAQSDETEETEEKKSEEDSESAPEEELGLDIEVPTELRERHHVEHLLKLDEEASETEKIINKIAEITLRELKKLYENAIKPLEGLYKYRDLSNRHFGDSEIFSKPLILFMGPWSGGKSSIINYLLDNEYNETSLRTGAEPSPAYFNILMHGEEPEIIDGTQLAADFTFSGLQKFGQGLEERLRGVKLPSKLLEKVNIVEIPGILEVRKQVSRVFPFNDACQWFIDRADIIFLVYDPSKLDVGPETEAILDQLKGREHQTRIILNKADQVKPEELMRVQGALIWNISPLMSSPQPPVMYTTSLWSRPYETWAPVRLLQAQERSFLRDLRSAVDKRIENKIASARRFAVRVRNHAKMVDCYLTTYYNHKSVFGNRKQVADEIIEHPQDYHIYEGLSTLTNISRYDLPDPDVYKDFFKLNPLYEFQQLSATCTYFRGCPINRLDVAIAYDLPELVGKHRRLVEGALAEVNQSSVPGS